jgi:hypothetical protein
MRLYKQKGVAVSEEYLAAVELTAAGLPSCPAGRL